MTNFAQLTTDLLADLKPRRSKPNATGSNRAPSENLADLLGDLELNARKIREHGKRADGIVSTMLEHSRGEAARHRPTDLNELVQRYTDLAYHGLRAQDPTLQASVTTDLDPAVGSVDLIAEHFSRVILNLVNNACYAANKRRSAGEITFQPRVTVQTRLVGDSVAVRVGDNGGGIPADLRNRIFDPFFTTKPTGSGTGLGLSLSHDIIVGGHRGDLLVESTEGVGTTFIATIPRQQ